MTFIDIMDVAQELAEVVEDLQFKVINEVSCLVTDRCNLLKVTKWLSENDITNVKFHIKGSEVKLYLS